MPGRLSRTARLALVVLLAAVAAPSFGQEPAGGPASPTATATTPADAPSDAPVEAAPASSTSTAQAEAPTRTAEAPTRTAEAPTRTAEAPTRTAAARVPPSRGAEAPLLPEGVESAIDVVELVIETAVLLAVIAVLGVVVVKVFAPKLGPTAGKSGDLIRVVAFRRIEPRTTLYLVEVGGKHVLLSVSDRDVQALTDVSLDTEGVEAAVAALDADAPARGAFRVLLNRRGKPGDG
jgi:flagellar biogenesis protein FliO